MSTSRDGEGSPWDKDSNGLYLAMQKSAFSPRLQTHHSCFKYSHERKISQSVPWEKGSQAGMFSPGGGVLAAQRPQHRSCPPCEPPMHVQRSRWWGGCWCSAPNYLGKSSLFPLEYSVSSISVSVWGGEEIHSFHKYLPSLHCMPGAVKVLGI